MFDHEWKMVTWGIWDQSGVWFTLLISKMTQNAEKEPISLDVAIVCPVNILKHVSHHSGYNEISFKQIPPAKVFKILKWQPPAEESHLNVNLEHKPRSKSGSKGGKSKKSPEKSGNSVSKSRKASKSKDKKLKSKSKSKDKKNKKRDGSE